MIKIEFTGDSHGEQ